VSKLESDLGFAASDSTEVRAQLLAHAAIRCGRPQVILNRRRDVREGEIFREIGAFETKDPEDVVSEPDGIVSG